MMRRECRCGYEFPASETGASEVCPNCGADYDPSAPLRRSAGRPSVMDFVLRLLEWARPAARWLGRQASLVFRFYWNQRQNLYRRLREYLGLTESSPEHNREIRLSGADNHSRADFHEDTWEVELPACCVTCGRPTSEPAEVWKRTLPDLTRLLLAPTVGLLVGLLVLSFAGKLLGLICITSGLVVGYRLQRRIPVRLQLRRCPEHLQDKSYPLVWAWEDVLVIRAGDESVRSQFRKLGRRSADPRATEEQATDDRATDNRGTGVRDGGSSEADRHPRSDPTRPAPSRRAKTRPEAKEAASEYQPIVQPPPRDLDPIPLFDDDSPASPASAPEESASPQTASPPETPQGGRGSDADGGYGLAERPKSGDAPGGPPADDEPSGEGLDIFRTSVISGPRPAVAAPACCDVCLAQGGFTRDSIQPGLAGRQFLSQHGWRVIGHTELAANPLLQSRGCAAALGQKSERRSHASITDGERDAWLREVVRKYGESSWLLCRACGQALDRPQPLVDPGPGAIIASPPVRSRATGRRASGSRWGVILLPTILGGIGWVVGKLLTQAGQPWAVPWQTAAGCAAAGLAMSVLAMLVGGRRVRARRRQIGAISAE